MSFRIRMDDFSSRQEKAYYLLLEALKFRGINDTSHFIGTEHPIMPNEFTHWRRNRMTLR